MDVDEVLRDGYRSARVCSECVEEADLRAYITSADGEPGCSFCNRDDAPTCEFLDFMDHVGGCIQTEYDLGVCAAGRFRKREVGIRRQIADRMESVRVSNP